MMNYLASSSHGQLISIQYYLRFFVKHDSLAEWGEGHCVTLPIWIQ